MENQEIRTIVLHLNDEEVKQKTENLKTRLREAARLKKLSRKRPPTGISRKGKPTICETIQKKSPNAIKVFRA